MIRAKKAAQAAAAAAAKRWHKQLMTATIQYQNSSWREAIDDIQILVMLETLKSNMEAWEMHTESDPFTKTQILIFIQLEISLDSTDYIVVSS